MRTAPRPWRSLCLTLLVGLVVLLGGAPATATPVRPAPAGTTGVVVAQQQPTEPTTQPAQQDSQQPQNPEQNQDQNRTWIALIAVALLATVYYGRKVRAKKRS
ncbi:MAG TPA: hypothetical protein VIL00_18120 [Pseudonocardiaceae bacterium]